MSAVIKQLPNEPVDVSSAIVRMASDPAVDVAKLEKLMELHERMQARSSEAQFNECMTAAQMEMRPIAADAENPQTRSKYASYAALDRALRPIYTRHGFSISYDTGDTPKPDHIRVLAYVARSGFSRTYKVDMPADGKGAKGGDVMTKTHATGAAMSYGSRYLLKMIFNVSVGEDDSDGNVPTDLVSQDEAANIEALISEVKADRTKFLRYLKVGKLSEIPKASYSTVVRLLEAKRARS